MTDETQPSPIDSAPDQPAAAASTDDADLRRELDQARARADESYRSWQRTAADFANFKRRVDDEKRFGERWLLQDLLPVLDDFERAWATVPRDLVKLTWLEGLLQINSKLVAVAERHGLSPIEAEGKDFNPLEHDAVMRDEDGDPTEQTAVVAVLQRGYRLHDRVLRPALVKVGKPTAQQTGSSEAQQPPSAEHGPIPAGPASTSSEASSTAEATGEPPATY